MRERTGFVLVALLLVAGLVAAAAEDGGDDEPERPRSVGPPPAELDEALLEMQSFVSDQRGLPFRQPVRIAVVDDVTFATRARERLVPRRRAIERSERILRAVGMIGPRNSLEDALARYYGTAEVAVFDPEAGEILLRAQQVTPYIESSLVHELTEALDHQHFDLARPELTGLDDASLAFAATVEGDAVRIEDRFVAQLDQDEAIERNDEERFRAGRVDPLGLGGVVAGLVQFGYAPGRTFVGRLADNGGERRVDVAFRQPPSTTEQVLFPQTYRPGAAAPPPVSAPAADGAVVDQGVLGVWFLNLLLSPQLGPETTNRAVEGWNGDRYAIWSAGGVDCLRATVAVDTRADVDELAAALREWAEDRPGATVTTTGTSVTFAGCGDRVRPARPS